MIIDKPGEARVDTVADPTPKPNEVIIRVGACGICGTDLHEYAAGPIVTPVHPHRFTGATLRFQDADTRLYGLR